MAINSREDYILVQKQHITENGDTPAAISMIPPPEEDEDRVHIFGLPIMMKV